MVVLLSGWSITSDQDPPKKKKQTHYQQKVDTVTVVNRMADTLMLKQQITMNKLDSLIIEQKRK